MNDFDSGNQWLSFGRRHLPSQSVDDVDLIKITGNSAHCPGGLGKNVETFEYLRGLNIN